MDRQHSSSSTDWCHLSSLSATGTLKMAPAHTYLYFLLWVVPLTLWIFPFMLTTSLRFWTIVLPQAEEYRECRWVTGDDCLIVVALNPLNEKLSKSFSTTATLLRISSENEKVFMSPRFSPWTPITGSWPPCLREKTVAVYIVGDLECCPPLSFINCLSIPSGLKSRKSFWCSVCRVAVV